MNIDSSLILQIIFLFILVGINAFFASSEIAIISLNDKKIRKMAEEGHKKAKLLQNLISEPSRFLATIQVGITLSGLLASAFASESFADRITGAIISTGLPVNQSVVKLITVIIITFCYRILHLSLGSLSLKELPCRSQKRSPCFLSNH